jgi:anti-sigma regulatory factor (Ser/Thr protein kinase)
LPYAPTSAGLARRFVTAALHRWGLDILVEVVALLVGELVTNAIVHTSSGAVGLVVRLGDQAVRVEVHDASPRLPPRPGRPAAADDQGGRGLGLVAALATRWGVEVDAAGHGDGKVVWFEVASPGAARRKQ